MLRHDRRPEQDRVAAEVNAELRQQLEYAEATLRLGSATRQGHMVARGMRG